MSRRQAAAEETRRRIVEATLAAHAEQGIAATSWEDIARRAGVGVGTVYRHFPRLDQLLPACGELTFRRLAFPSSDEVVALFAGAASLDERVRRLVAELFGVYERCAGGIENVRRERELHPSLEEAAQQIDATIDALVREALGPADDARARAVVRALTDVAVWRSLGKQGITGEAASETVATALMGWLSQRERGAS